MLQKHVILISYELKQILFIYSIFACLLLVMKTLYLIISESWELEIHSGFGPSLLLIFEEIYYSICVLLLISKFCF